MVRRERREGITIINDLQIESEHLVLSLITPTLKGERASEPVINEFTFRVTALHSRAFWHPPLRT